MLISVSPVQYQQQTSSIEKLGGFSITSSKKWTLKDSKEDETTPGPKYEIQYLNSVTDGFKRRGKFGISRDESIESRATENKIMVSPAKYYADYIGQRIKLSHRRLPQQYSMPKGDRGLLSGSTSEGPTPQSYSNTNVIAAKVTLLNRGSVGLPKQERKVDFCKYSSVHSELVEKGIY